jgi:RNA polymerase sigma-70 factor (ECF subfamily)
MTPLHALVRFFVGLLQKAPMGLEIRRVRVNGPSGLMAMLGGEVDNVLTLDVADGRIAACFVVRNPDKLARVATGQDRPARRDHFRPAT